MRADRRLEVLHRIIKNPAPAWITPLISKYWTYFWFPSAFVGISPPCARRLSQCLEITYTKAELQLLLLPRALIKHFLDTLRRRPTHTQDNIATAIRAPPLGRIGIGATLTILRIWRKSIRT